LIATTKATRKDAIDETLYLPGTNSGKPIAATCFSASKKLNNPNKLLCFS